MNRHFIRTLAVALAVLGAGSLFATPLAEGRRGEILADGTQVQLILDGDPLGDVNALVAASGGRRYYYLPPPTTVRLSKRPDGVPEFLLVKFTTEKREAEGGVNGAIMHFLMEYGLTPEQEAELREKLKATGDELLGPMPMKPEGDASSFVITSATLKDQGFTKTLAISGKAPILPGQKVAAAARLTGDGAQLFATTLEKARSIADCSITFNLTYTVVTPAVRGYAKFNSEKFASEGESLYRNWQKTAKKTTKKWWGFSSETTESQTVSYDEVQNAWQFLTDTNLVEVKFVDTVTDERAAKIRDAVMESFMNAFFSSMESEEPPPAPAASSDDKSEKPPVTEGVTNIYRVKTNELRKSRTWNFSYGLAMNESHSLTGNLGAWYRQVRDNPACVIATNLNDPFFTHRDINFILDLDAKEMFDEVVNYVTINVRKTRSSGRPFEDHRTIDAAYLKSKGVAARVTYARGDDTNPEAYQYQAQWSIKGGNVFPANPKWEKGTWEGVTLAPPVRPLTIELEGDIEALKEQGITRVTAEVHYSQFGKEMSDVIHLSALGNQPIVTKKLFRDRDMDKYAYRLIINHKGVGKLVTKWEKDQIDGYIPVVLPTDLLTAEDFRERAKNLAAGVLENVLDRLGGKLTGGTN